MQPEPLEVFRAYVDAWNRHDAPAIVATFADGGTYTDPTTPGPLTGAAIGDYAKALWKAFPDLSFEVLSSLENGDGLFSAEWHMGGTNTGSMYGLPPTGKTISVRGADFVRVKGGKIQSVQGYFDSGAVPRSLGLDVIVQPTAIGPFEFGTSVRVSSGSRAVPGAFSITVFEARNEDEKLAIRESGRKISEEMLSIRGFISVVTATVGDRLMTITAWDNSDSMAPLMKGGEHRAAVGRYFQSELGGRGGMTGIWIPGRLNPRRVRCEECSKMAPVNDAGDRCSCGATLSGPLAYW
jgi:steroid delta-isomerase-like uncharacterized protein